nr:hypothetical protein [Tanacetum cinerariifolium]
QSGAGFFLWGLVRMGKMCLPRDFLGVAVEKEEEKGGNGFGEKTCKQCITQ